MEIIVDESGRLTWQLTSARFYLAVVVVTIYLHGASARTWLRPLAFAGAVEQAKSAYSKLTPDSIEDATKNLEKFKGWALLIKSWESS